MPRKQMWFGNQNRFQWTPAPASGMEVTNVGFVEQIDYETGRVGIVRSMQTHKEFGMEFPLQEATGLEGLDVYNKYASGFYGDTDTYPLFFADPMNYDQNLLPPGWASPGLYARGWAGIVESGQRAYYNHALNPSVELTDAGYTRTTGTSGVATGARTLTTSVSGQYSYRVTWTTATTAVSGGANYIGTPVAPGTSYDFSIHVTASKTQRVLMTVRWRNSIGTSIGTSAGTATVLAATTATKLSVVGATAPVGAITADIEIAAVAGTSGTNWAVGNWIQVDAVAIGGTGTTAPVFYFDGDTPGASWAGTPSASYSVMYVPRAQVTTGNTPTNSYNLPPVQATYSVTTPPNTAPSGAQNIEVPYALIPIPPTHTLRIGATGSFTGTAQLVVEAFPASGAAAVTTALTLLSPTGATRMNFSVSGSTYSHVRVYVRRTSTAVSTITLSSMMAQLWPTGVTPNSNGDFIEGKGHRGLKFADNATVESYVMVDLERNIPVHYKGLSTRLTEAQDVG